MGHLSKYQSPVRHKVSEYDSYERILSTLEDIVDTGYAAIVMRDVEPNGDVGIRVFAVQVANMITSFSDSVEDALVTASGNVAEAETLESMKHIATGGSAED